jgi:NTE family protein
MIDYEKIDTLVLSGGGWKGLCQLGILHYLVENSLINLENIDRSCSVSIGSVISLLLMCKWTPIEIFRKVYMTNNFFSDVPNIWTIINNLKDKYGILSLDKFVDIVEDMIKEELGYSPTLLELYDNHGKDFSVIAVNILTSEPELISYRNKPHLKAINAMKMSCSIPFIFEKCEIDDVLYVDGGLLNNFPYGYMAKEVSQSRILGIAVSGTFKKDKVTSLMTYIYRVLVAPINMSTNMQTCKYTDVINMNVDNVSLFSMTLPESDKMDLFLRGYNYIKNIIEKKDTQKDYDGWDVEFDI